MLWQVVIGTAAGFVVLWLALLASLYLAGRHQQHTASFSAVVRLLPDVLRLLRRLASDHSLPRGVRLRLVLLLAYLLSPIDLVPDFIPVVGYADDAVIVALALRSVARAAGPHALDRHWPGSPDGLQALKRIAGLR